MSQLSERNPPATRALRVQNLNRERARIGQGSSLSQVLARLARLL